MFPSLEEVVDRPCQVQMTRPYLMMLHGRLDGNSGLSLESLWLLPYS